MQDRYSGIMIDSKDLPPSAGLFDSQLQTSLELWRAENKRGVWLKVAQDKADLIAVAVRQGFNFHHVNKDMLMMNQWLPKEEANKLPNYASHFIGVGGLVWDQKNKKVLLVQDKRSAKKGIWKFPGGLVDPKESLGMAAEREVKEETGVSCSFQKMLCFRETESYQFDCPDIYFVALMSPSSLDITIQEDEIAQCAWFDQDEVYDLFGQISIQKFMREILLKLFRGEDKLCYQAHEYFNSVNKVQNTMYYPESVDLPKL